VHDTNGLVVNTLVIDIMPQRLVTSLDVSLYGK